MRHAKPDSNKLQREPRLPVEWLDAGEWRLPSGRPLAEFALEAGFLAPLLLKSESLKPLGKAVNR
jgi:hypothetical protein